MVEEDEPVKQLSDHVKISYPPQNGKRSRRYVRAARQEPSLKLWSTLQLIQHYNNRSRCPAIDHETTFRSKRKHKTLELRVGFRRCLVSYPPILPVLVLLLCLLRTTHGSSSSCMKSTVGAMHKIDVAGTKLACHAVGLENFGDSCWKCLNLDPTSDTYFVLTRYKSHGRVRKVMEPFELRTLGSCAKTSDLLRPEDTGWITETLCNQEPVSSASFSQMLNRKSFSRQANLQDSIDNLKVVSWKCNSTVLTTGRQQGRDGAAFGPIGNFHLADLTNLISHRIHEGDRSWLLRVLEALEKGLLQMCLDISKKAKVSAAGVPFVWKSRRRRLQSTHPTGIWRLLIIMDTVIGFLGFLIALFALTCCFCTRNGMRCWWQIACGYRTRGSDGSTVREFEFGRIRTAARPTNSPVAGDNSRLASPVLSPRIPMPTGTPVPASSFQYRAEPFCFEGLAAATEGFEEKNRVGEGSFGTVYRGILFDGRLVAVKRADLSNVRKIEDNQSAFEAELEVLSKLHHKNLVNLVGYCDDRDERVLVYEYMTNGTLHDLLHKRRMPRVLSSWKARIRLALQAARGIEYLHRCSEPPIIHRDIKSSNILLDSNWSARVSDFGLSLSFNTSSEDGSHLGTRTAAGSLGYMDLEYLRQRHLTTRSDVYSFGVVLLELLTGKRAIHRRNLGHISVVDYAIPKMEAGELFLILDARMSPPTEIEGAAIQVVAEVTQRCVRLRGKDRPSMTEVVWGLEHAVTICRPRDAEFPIFGAQVGSSSNPSLASVGDPLGELQHTEEEDERSIGSDVAQLGSLQSASSSTADLDVTFEDHDLERRNSALAVADAGPSTSYGGAPAPLFDVQGLDIPWLNAGRSGSETTEGWRKSWQDSWNESLRRVLDPSLAEAGRFLFGPRSGIRPELREEPTDPVQPIMAGFSDFGDGPPEDFDPPRSSARSTIDNLQSQLPSLPRSVVSSARDPLRGAPMMRALSGSSNSESKILDNIPDVSENLDGIDIEEFLEEYSDERPGSISYAGYSVHQDLEDLIRALENEHPARFR